VLFHGQSVRSRADKGGTAEWCHACHGRWGAFFCVLPRPFGDECDAPVDVRRQLVPLGLVALPARRYAVVQGVWATFGDRDQMINGERPRMQMVRLVIDRVTAVVVALGPIFGDRAPEPITARRVTGAHLRRSYWAPSALSTVLLQTPTWSAISLNSRPAARKSRIFWSRSEFRQWLPEYIRPSRPILRTSAVPARCARFLAVILSVPASAAKMA